MMETTFDLIVLLFVSLCSDSHRCNVVQFKRQLAPEKSHRCTCITHPKVLFQHCLTNLTKLPFVNYSTNLFIRIQVGLTMTREYFWYTLYIQNMTNVASLAWKLNHHQSYANQVKSVKFLLGVGNLIFFCKIAKSLIYVSV